MCGIVATFGGTPIQDAMKCFEKQRGRGTEGYGYLALKDGKIIDFKRTSTEGEIIRELQHTDVKKPDCILFHHRFPTSTINVPEAAHPLPINKKGWQNKYYILHNGVVNGQDEDKIADDGYEMKSRISEVKYYRAGGRTYEMIVDSEVNDSEYLGYYIASLLEGERKDIPMSGAIAAIVVQENKKTKLCTVFAMRNYMNPLQVHRQKHEGSHTLRLSSEGTGQAMPINMIHVLDWKTLAFSDYLKVSIGKEYEYSSNFSYMGYDNGYVGIGTKADKPPTDVPPRDEKISSFKGGSESAIISQEYEKLTTQADAAYAEAMEAKEMLGEDDSPEAKQWVAELVEKWEELEERRDELAEMSLNKIPF